MADLSANDALRFLLEVSGLAAYGYWGWVTHPGPFRAVWAVGAVLVVAVLWGVFRVPGDPGPAPVAVPGPVRLGLEMLLFGLAAAALTAAGQFVAGFVYVLGVFLQYALGFDRFQRLLAGRYATEAP